MLQELRLNDPGHAAAAARVECRRAGSRGLLSCGKEASSHLGGRHGALSPLPQRPEFRHVPTQRPARRRSLLRRGTVTARPKAPNTPNGVRGGAARLTGLGGGAHGAGPTR